MDSIEIWPYLSTRANHSSGMRHDEIEITFHRIDTTHICAFLKLIMFVMITHAHKKIYILLTRNETSTLKSLTFFMTPTWPWWWYEIWLFTSCFSYVMKATLIAFYHLFAVSFWRNRLDYGKNFNCQPINFQASRRRWNSVVFCDRDKIQALKFFVPKYFKDRTSTKDTYAHKYVCIKPKQAYKKNHKFTEEVSLEHNQFCCAILLTRERKKLPYPEQDWEVYKNMNTKYQKNYINELKGEHILYSTI